MASTNIKLFDEKKLNMMSDTEYNISTQRLNGVQAGIASSQLQNKTLYQTSLIAYSLAQFMNEMGFDAIDSGSVPTFVNNLSSSIKKPSDSDVKYIPQSLTDAQKKQARGNIGAGNADKEVVFTLSLLASSWTATGDNYTQTVVVSGSTANSKIDLQPNADTIVQLVDDDVLALFVSNTGGTLTVYAVGGKPSVDLIVQASRTEVTV